MTASCHIPENYLVSCSHSLVCCGHEPKLCDLPSTSVFLCFSVRRNGVKFSQRRRRNWITLLRMESSGEWGCYFTESAQKLFLSSEEFLLMWSDFLLQDDLRRLPAAVFPPRHLPPNARHAEQWWGQTLVLRSVRRRVEGRIHRWRLQQQPKYDILLMFSPSVLHKHVLMSLFFWSFYGHHSMNKLFKPCASLFRLYKPTCFLSAELFCSNPQFFISLKEVDDKPHDGMDGCTVLICLMQKVSRKDKQNLMAIGFKVYKVKWDETTTV